MLDNAAHPVLTNDRLTLDCETVCIDTAFEQAIILVPHK